MLSLSLFCFLSGCCLLIWNIPCFQCLFFIEKKLKITFKPCMFLKRVGIFIVIDNTFLNRVFFSLFSIVSFVDFPHQIEKKNTQKWKQNLTRRYRNVNEFFLNHFESDLLNEAPDWRRGLGCVFISVFCNFMPFYSIHKQNMLFSVKFLCSGRTYEISCYIIVFTL